MTLYEFHHSCGIFFGHLDLKVMGYHVDPNSTGNLCTKIVLKSTSANVVLGQIERYHACGSDLLNSIVSTPQRSLVVLVTRVNNESVEIHVSISQHFNGVVEAKVPLLRLRHPLSNVKIQTFNEDLNNRWHIVNEGQCSIPFYSVTNTTVAGH